MGNAPMIGCGNDLEQGIVAEEGETITLPLPRRAPPDATTHAFIHSLTI